MGVQKATGVSWKWSKLKGPMMPKGPRKLSVISEAKPESSKVENVVHMDRVSNLHYLLQLCAKTGSSMGGRACHAQIIRIGLEMDILTSTMLINMYSKCSLVHSTRKKIGALTQNAEDRKALKLLIRMQREMFESMPEKNAVTWSSMMAGYVQNGFHDEALLLFHNAQLMGFDQDPFNISSAVSACAGLATLVEGKQVHAMSHKSGFGSNIYVASSLIDMYAKCGCIREAYLVFEGFVEVRSIVLWNAMISGFARHALAQEAMILFEKMQQRGFFPDDVTYVSVLNACSHMGLHEEGQKYFDLMRTKLTNCKASCRIYGNIEFAEIAAKHLFEMEPNNAGNHILLANIYAANKKSDEVARARKLLRETDVRKERGTSWIEIKNKIHSFTVGERNHPQIDDNYAKLDNLVVELKKLNYKVDTNNDLHDVEESRKHMLLGHHSEKLAITFGLVCLPTEIPIRIIKNLRICGDCHTFMKLVSKFASREIIVRDTNRFHHFKDGLCSCGEFR
ncbi:Pentatricopeptide repeat-containing protein, mitochondrial [Glycine max]|nr:Pentatricopeptide repeat-containing protein, mitochondrial [Glycine max]